eukprot:TCALIF_05875-PA protein Name:"Protein of unknown function" AED:0.11 eAED:0.11 QI:66/1/1/1/0/0.33/3/476/151
MPERLTSRLLEQCKQEAIRKYTVLYACGDHCISFKDTSTDINTMISHPGKRLTIFTKDQSELSSYTLVSHFVIDGVTLEDSGSYHCESMASRSDPVRVHVLVDGESPNAWKTNGAIAALTTTLTTRYHDCTTWILPIWLILVHKVPECLWI